MPQPVDGELLALAEMLLGDGLPGERIDDPQLTRALFRAQRERTDGADRDLGELSAGARAVQLVDVVVRRVDRMASVERRPLFDVCREICVDAADRRELRRQAWRFEEIRVSQACAGRLRHAENAVP